MDLVPKEDAVQAAAQNKGISRTTAAGSLHCRVTASVLTGHAVLCCALATCRRLQRRVRLTSRQHWQEPTLCL